MSRSKFEISVEEGHHATLHKMAGSWTGACKTWFEKDVLAGNIASEFQYIFNDYDSVKNRSEIIAFSKRFSKILVAFGRAKTMGEKLKILSSLKAADFKPKLPAVVEPRNGKS
ncbi:MAG: hypothetical protein EOO04_31185, partial [Chitinophagaceae bacterium]